MTESFPQPSIEIPHEKNAEADACPHGVNRGEICVVCLRESISEQPVWKMIAELQKTSRYTRSATDTPECVIEKEGKRYEVHLVRAGDENLIAEIQALSEGVFGREEVDSMEVLKAAIKGELPDGSRDLTRYRLYVARDESGKLQSVYAGGTMEMQNDRHEPTNESMFMGAYGVTRPESQRKGLVRELYISSMMQAAMDSHTEKRRLVMIAGECTWSSERAWNAVGRRRVYVETGRGEYTELPYIQPALEFDPDTGLPLEESGEAPEHLMVQFLEGNPNKEKIIAAIDSIYRWCNVWPRSTFTSDHAYATHVRYLEDFQKRYTDFFSKNGALHLLSPEERKALKAKGIPVHEHTEADGN